MLEGGDTAGVEASNGLGGWKLLGELAFEPARGYHAVVGDSPSGPRVSVKGAPEVVLPRWRVSLAYEFIPRLWLLGGVDDIFSATRRDYFVGMQLRFNDEDLKTILPFAKTP